MEDDFEIFYERLSGNWEVRDSLDHHFDFVVGKDGSAFETVSVEERRNMLSVAADWSGGCFFTTLNEEPKDRPIFFISSEGGFCYFAKSLKQCIQCVISLPVDTWHDAIFSSESKNGMILAISRAVQDAKSETESQENIREFRAEDKAANQISSELQIELINNAVDVLFDNIRQTPRYKITNIHGDYFEPLYDSA